MVSALCTDYYQCFFAGFLSGPDSWEEDPECWLIHLVVGEVGVPEKYEGLVSRAGLKHLPSF